MIQKVSYYDPEGPEWIFRDDFAYRIDNLVNLNDLINSILSMDSKLESRVKVKDLLYGEFQDGNNAKRIATHIISLLSA